MLAAITAAYAGFVGCGSPGTRRPAAPEATPATRPAAGAAAASALGDGADDGVFPTVRDWPQWRGLNRDATSPERITIWPPRQIWQRDVGNGVSSVIACRGRAFALGREGDQDAVFCLDAAGGEVLWKHLYASKDDHTSDVKLPGPRSTPATDGLRLYTLSLEGRLLCLDAPTGNVLWERKPAELGAFIGQYGLCTPLLLHRELLVLDVNAACVALDKVTGREVWRVPGGKGWNGTGPVAMTIRGQEHILYGTGRCVRRTDGRAVWEVPFNEWTVATPIVIGEAAFLAPFHGRNLGGLGCALVRTTADGRAEVIWNNDEVEALCSTGVLHRGYLYVPDRDDLRIAGESGRLMNLKCLDAATGRCLWTQRPIPWPNPIVAGDRLLIQTLMGELILVDPAPEGYRELGREDLLTGRYWSVPALARGRLFCRSNTGRVTAFRVGQAENG